MMDEAPLKAMTTDELIALSISTRQQITDLSRNLTRLAHELQRRVNARRSGEGTDVDSY
jgi:hypothetical protein